MFYFRGNIDGDYEDPSKKKIVCKPVFSYFHCLWPWNLIPLYCSLWVGLQIFLIFHPRILWHHLSNPEGLMSPIVVNIIFKQSPLISCKFKSGDSESHEKDLIRPVLWGFPLDRSIRCLAEELVLWFSVFFRLIQVGQVLKWASVI